MPKAKTGELSELRSQALERDQTCRWPACDHKTEPFVNPLEMAHLTHRGMGGSTDVNTLSEVVILCKAHHDILDGRQGMSKLRSELVRMLRHANNLF